MWATWLLLKMNATFNMALVPRRKKPIHFKRVQSFICQKKKFFVHLGKFSTYLDQSEIKDAVTISTDIHLEIKFNLHSTTFYL